MVSEINGSEGMRVWGHEMERSERKRERILSSCWLVQVVKLLQSSSNSELFKGQVSQLPFNISTWEEAKEMTMMVMDRVVIMIWFVRNDIVCELD